MCTKGSVGEVSADTIGRYIDRYVGRYSVDTRPSIGRVSTDTIGRYLAEYRPSVGRVSTDISVDISVDGISVNCRWHIGQLSVVYRCDVGGTGEINKD